MLVTVCVSLMRGHFNYKYKMDIHIYQKKLNIYKIL